MESYYSGVKTGIFALFCALFITKSKDSVIKFLDKQLKTRVMFWIPLQVRINMVKKTLDNPSEKTIQKMASLTIPWGEQLEYITKVETDTFKGHWIISPSDKLTGNLNKIETNLTKNIDQTDLVFYYFHGGAFKYGTSTMDMDTFMFIIKQLKSKGLNAKIFSLDYNQIPKVKHAQTKMECIEGYRYLTKKLNIPANKIIVAGASAGGNLVATCLQMIKNDLNDELSLPLGNIMVSPWVSIENGEFTEEKDYVVYNSLVTKETHEFFDTNMDYKNPSASPLYGSFHGFCPTLVAYGGTEILRFQIKQLIEKLEQQGVDTTVVVRPNAPHCWITAMMFSPTYKDWVEDITKVTDWCASLVL